MKTATNAASTEVQSMTAHRTIHIREGAALVALSILALLAALAAPRDAAAGLGPVPVVGAAVSADALVDVGPGIAVVVCHVGVGAHALGIPVVVQAGEVGAFLAANPRDYVGACASGDGGSSKGDSATGASVAGAVALQAGLLERIADGARVVVCAPGDGQLFLTADAAASLVRTDPRVTFGSCAASRASDGGGTADASTGGRSETTSSGASGAVFVDGRVSVPANTLTCGDRLIVTRVATMPRVVRTKNAKVTTRLVIVNDQGHLVRGATVWLRSAPLGLVTSSSRGTTSIDGSVRFTLSTTKRLPLRAGGRLVLFARATLPGKTLISCVTGRRLISVRVSAPPS
jgi:hypothetical protein